MLSILIPTYNYNVYPLVTELKNQADAIGIAYEILVQDDASKYFLEENTEINLLQHCSYTLNHENLGRGNNINLLNNRAQFQYVLIMEADAFPEKKTYLQDVIASINPETQVLFGGVNYPNEKPEKDKLLRWKYGNERESIPLSERLKNPYHFVFTWNLLLKKEILSNYHFPYNVKDYGYEDVVFIKQLKENNIPIQHIENRLVHFNIESSSTFIEKTEKAVTTLNQLIGNKKLDLKDTKIGKAYNIIQFWQLDILIRFLFKKLSKKMISNLTSSNPSLLILDLYKLGYFCLLNQEKHV
ncbi:glycosyltransferase [Flavobacterium lacisediminis]|uniref:Glycosyltransferase n=1 Tax=Flavobacterium lacisediminis TaxID=2989705 RepID=A0ABT3EHQ0_9FLAO|nr:glycosyltransferase [Flavobacterium lacisediminis]MCW1147614.1 glycosyltransferase [Flavobacterium lacisediminis]